MADSTVQSNGRLSFCCGSLKNGNELGKQLLGLKVQSPLKNKKKIKFDVDNFSPSTNTIGTLMITLIYSFSV